MQFTGKNGQNNTLVHPSPFGVDVPTRLETPKSATVQYMQLTFPSLLYTFGIFIIAIKVLLAHVILNKKLFLVYYVGSVSGGKNKRNGICQTAPVIDSLKLSVITVSVEVLVCNCCCTTVLLGIT